MLPIIKEKTLSTCNLEEFSFALKIADSEGLKETAVSEYFGTGDRYGVCESYTISEYEHRKTQYVWKEFFEKEKFELVKESNFRFLDEGPAIITNLEISEGKFIKIYQRATLFYKKEDIKIVVSIEERQNGVYIYEFSANKSINSLFEDLKKFSNEKHLFRGKKIDCNCNFLKLENISWDDVFIEDECKNVIKSNVERIFTLSPKLKKHNLPIKRGLIIYGPPGTGKTQVCKCLSKDVKCSVLYALPSDFMRDAAGVRRVCKMAQDLAPCLLIIEDIDWVAQDRTANNAGFVMDLMNQLDGLESFGDIITIGTTNALTSIEEAMKNRPGRFDRTIKIGNPEPEQIRKMIFGFTKNFVLHEKLNIDSLCNSLEGLTGAHIKDICNMAAVFAIEEESMVDDKILLKKSHFAKVITEVKNKDYSSFMKKQSQSENGPLGFAAANKNKSISDFLDEEDIY